MTMRVLLADDHVFVRKGVREFLEEEPDTMVRGEAGDGLLPLGTKIWPAAGEVRPR